jgi:biopolymer transport protein ExbB
MLSNVILQLMQAAQTATEVATQTATTVSTTKSLNIFSLAVKGGWIMIVLGILSIIAVYIFVDRYLALNKALKEDTSFMNNVKNCIHNNDLQGAKNLCAANNSPIGRMISKGISRLGRPLNDINQAVENVGNLEISKLESGVSMIATISNLSPSLGFPWNSNRYGKSIL